MYGFFLWKRNNRGRDWVYLHFGGREGLTGSLVPPSSFPPHPSWFPEEPSRPFSFGRFSLGSFIFPRLSPCTLHTQLSAFHVVSALLRCRLSLSGSFKSILSPPPWFFPNWLCLPERIHQQYGRQLSGIQCLFFYLQLIWTLDILCFLVMLKTWVLCHFIWSLVLCVCVIVCFYRGGQYVGRFRFTPPPLSWLPRIPPQCSL